MLHLERVIWELRLEIVRKDKRMNIKVKAASEDQRNSQQHVTITCKQLIVIIERQ